MQRVHWNVLCGETHTRTPINTPTHPLTHTPTHTPTNTHRRETRAPVPRVRGAEVPVLLRVLRGRVRQRDAAPDAGGLREEVSPVSLVSPVSAVSAVSAGELVLASEPVRQ